MRPERYKHALLLEQHNKLNPHVTNLCRTLKIHRTTYYDVLKGKVGVSLEMLEAIANALELSLSDVIVLEKPAILACA